MTDLTRELLRLSDQTERATAKAKEAGNEAMFHELRKLAWHVAKLVGDSERGHELERVS